MVGSFVVAPDVMAAATPPWMNTASSADQRADLLAAAMTLDQKIALITNIKASIPELGIPAVVPTDGCCGVASLGGLPSTSMPDGNALAATADTGLARQYGAAIGHEAFLLGFNQLAGPTLDLMRVANDGRTFESFGEDPILTGRMAAAQVQGIQQNPVIALPKHYNLNNQETLRNFVDEKVDERTLQELYTTPWIDVVKIGNAGSVTCAFNKVNGIYACNNKHLLTDILKDELGFKGFVVSDFTAVMGPEYVANGLDTGTPAEALGPALLAAVQAGTVPLSRINDAVHRILRTYFGRGLFDQPAPAPGTSLPADVQQADQALARSIEDKAIVLLKNQTNSLPLTKRAKSIAVIGSDADFNIQGAGSAGILSPTHVTTILQGIQNRAGSSASVSYAPGTDPLSLADTVGGPAPVPSSVLTPSAGTGAGLTARYWPTLAFAGDPQITRNELQANLRTGIGDSLIDTSQIPGLPFNLSVGDLSAKYTGYLTPPANGTYQLALTHLGTATLSLDGRQLINNPGTALGTQTVGVPLVAGRRYAVEIDYQKDAATNGPALSGLGAIIRFAWTPPKNVLSPAEQQAVALAKTSSVAVVVARDFRSEEYDNSLQLQQDQDRLIEAVAKVNPHTVVVLATGGPVLTPWLSKVSAVIEAWYGGQEQGAAVADVLFGDVNPSGKLPMSFPTSESTQPVHTVAQFPGLPANDLSPTVVYSEKLGIGYRGYDLQHLTPQFPFGHGLSYTTFKYSPVRVVAPHAVQGNSKKAPVQVSFQVKNTGRLAGSELAQVYVGVPASAGEPPKRLVAWTKVTLRAGQQKIVNVTIDPNAPDHPLGYYNVAGSSWKIAPGVYTVYVGTNERNTPLVGRFTE